MDTKTTAKSILSASVALFLTHAAIAASEPAGATPSDPVADIFTKGKVSLTLRPRVEWVDQSNRKDTDAHTVRTALSFTTAAYKGFTAMIEAEDVSVLPGSDYAPYAGASPNIDARAVVADPEGTEINQAWIAYKTGATTLKAGRINLVLDNARFIGNVGWRQNTQTFDGATVQGSTASKVSYSYGYLHHINRIFGDGLPGGNWDSDSHLLNIGYAGLPAGAITAYAYLLDFDNAAANSCATYGLSFAGSQGKDLKFTYRAEYATQSDYGSSSLDYSTDYLLGELAVGKKGITGGLGYEVLGTDHNVGFKTPLATLHAFNGWADMFLSTPAGGLRDAYAKVSATVTKDFSLLGFYHTFETDTGIDLGKEIDLQATYRFTKYVSGLVKFATFDTDSSFADVTKYWVQLEFKY